MLSFSRWKSLVGVADLAVKGRNMEELGAVKGTKLLVGRQKLRNIKSNFLASYLSLKILRRKLFIVTGPSLKTYVARLGIKIMKDSVASHHGTAMSQILKMPKICFFLW